MSNSKNASSSSVTVAAASRLSEGKRAVDRVHHSGSHPMYPPAHTSSCDDKCRKTHPPKPATEARLLQYVLRTKPTDSLPDLSDVVHPHMLTKRVGKGGFSEVYQTSIAIKGKTHDVAVKRLKLDQRKPTKNFAKELRIASRLNHPNVLKAVGYVHREGENQSHMYIVSEWMDGSLRAKLKDFTQDQLFSMSKGIAEGMCYLHSLAVVHADLKADNVLVSHGPPGNLKAKLADFGLSRMKESCWSTGYYTTETSRESARWMAYEFYHHDSNITFRPNQKTDVWAFGMTLLELIERDMPYKDLRSDHLVTSHIVRGKLPAEPDFNASGDIRDRKLKVFMWSLCKQCWELKPKTRPFMIEILKQISNFHICQ